MIKYIIVHHTAYSRKDNPDQFIQTNQFHQEKWGMKSSLGYYGGYNFEIASDGTVRQMRAIGEETIGATGYNFNSIHIALDGNFDLELPTEAQVKSLRSLLEKYVKEYSIYPSNIVPHRHVASKSCYGRLLSDTWARDLLYPSGKPQPTEQDLLIIILRLRIQIAQFMVQLLSGKKTAGFHSCGNSS